MVRRETVYVHIQDRWHLASILEYDYQKRPSAPFKVELDENRQHHCLTLQEIKSVPDYLKMEEELDEKWIVSLDHGQ